MFLHQKLSKGSFFLKLCLYNRALYWLSPKQSFFSQNAPAYLHIEHYFDFLPNNSFSFYTKNSQRVNFSLNFDYNTGHFIDFSPKKVIFSSKCACISSTNLTFLPNNHCGFTTKIPKKPNFSSNCAYNIGHFMTFLPKKLIFPQYAPAYQARFWLFCPSILIAKCN